MAITVVRPEDRELESVSKQQVSGDLPDSVRNMSKRQIVSGDVPYVHIAELPPGAEVPVHSHTESEVTVILSGTARLGGAEAGPGSVLVIPADEPYDLAVVGDEPLTFLVVRPRAASYSAG